MKSFFALKGGQDKKASEQESSHFGKQERSQSPSLAQVYHPAKQTHVAQAPPGGGGSLGYFLGGYVPPGTPNWHPVLKQNPLKLIPRSRNGPIFYTPF